MTPELSGRSRVRSQRERARAWAPRAAGQAWCFSSARRAPAPRRSRSARVLGEAPQRGGERVGPRVVGHEPGGLAVHERLGNAPARDDRAAGLHVVEQLDREAARAAARQQRDGGAVREQARLLDAADLDHAKAPEARRARFVRGDHDGQRRSAAPRRRRARRGPGSGRGCPRRARSRRGRGRARAQAAATAARAGAGSGVWPGATQRDGPARRRLRALGAQPRSAPARRRPRARARGRARRPRRAPPATQGRQPRLELLRPERVRDVDHREPQAAAQRERDERGLGVVREHGVEGPRAVRGGERARERRSAASLRGSRPRQRAPAPYASSSTSAPASRSACACSAAKRCEPSGAGKAKAPSSARRRDCIERGCKPRASRARRVGVGSACCSAWGAGVARNGRVSGYFLWVSGWAKRAFPVGGGLAGMEVGCPSPW